MLTAVVRVLLMISPKEAASLSTPFFLKDLCRKRTRAERALGTPTQDSCVNKAFLTSDGPQCY